jgi:hypothetical protein
MRAAEEEIPLFKNARLDPTPKAHVKIEDDALVSGRSDV